jgi:hypothetical protein
MLYLGEEISRFVSGVLSGIVQGLLGSVALITSFIENWNYVGRPVEYIE